MIFKRLYIFILLQFNILLFAQLDLEHWFPPLYLPTGHTIENVKIYLSTPHKDSFEIKIFDTNDVIYTRQISSNEPIEIELPLNSTIVSALQGMAIVKKGIHVSGEKSFYASIRLNFDNGYNTDIISSKGKTAFGYVFYTTNAPYNDYYNKKSVNYSTSFIATRDNTHIKISGFDERIVFSDGNKYPNGINITLNKGESYCLVSRKTDNFSGLEYSYWDSFIGAKITSDKPIVVNNGNFTGVHFLEGNGKLMIDQTLPADKLGKEYYIHKAFTDIDWAVEGLLLVSTSNDTKIYVNDKKDDIYTLNEGKYLLLDKENFSNDGIYINSNKPIYAYQLLGGNNNTARLIIYPYLTPSMSSVFPLDESLPSGTINLPNIEMIGNKSFDNIVTILSPNGANISINDLPIDNIVYPKQNINGNNNWFYQIINNLKGNIKISSNKSIIIGIAGGYETQKIFGSFGAYYTAFTNDPFIKVNGNCIEELITLSINNINFEKFQWKLNNVDIPGANNFFYQPKLPGLYSCQLSYSGYTIITGYIEVKNCDYNISEVNLDKFCESFDYVPKFTKNNKNIKVDDIEILTQPTASEAVINNNVNLTITSSNLLDNIEDRVIVKIKNYTKNIEEVQKITYTLLPKPKSVISTQINSTTQIDDENFIYNLNDVIIENHNDSFHFFSTLDDLNNNINEISIWKEFVTKSDQIFLVISNIKNDCIRIEKINLIKIKSEKRNNFNNVITPNFDSINDNFNFSSYLRSNPENFSLNIYDRYGMIIYSFKKNDKENWDGIMNTGQKAQSGIYWIVISYLNKETGSIDTIKKWIYIKN